MPGLNQACACWVLQRKCWRGAGNLGAARGAGPRTAWDVTAHGSWGLWVPAPYRIELLDATKYQEPGARGAFNAPGAKFEGQETRL